MEEFRRRVTSFLATRTNAPLASRAMIPPVDEGLRDLVERARDTCACAFEHLLSYGVHMLSVAERARAPVLQMASAERVAMDRWPEHGAVGAVKAHARRVRRSRPIRRTHLSHCVSRRASAPRRGRLSVGGLSMNITS